MGAAPLLKALEQTVLCCEKAPEGYEVEPAGVGCYVSGMSLQGASWDAEGCRLAPARLLRTLEALPVMHLLPQQDDATIPSALASQARKEVTIDCPVYTTRDRIGAVLAPNYDSGRAGTV